MTGTWQTCGNNQRAVLQMPATVQLFMKIPDLHNHSLAHKTLPLDPAKNQ